MACLTERNRDTSPISSPQVRATIGPTPGAVLRFLILSVRTDTLTHFSVVCEQLTEVTHLVAACCGSFRFPAVGLRPGSSSEPSGAPAGADSAECGADLESLSKPYGIQAGNHNASSPRSCRHLLDHS